MSIRNGGNRNFMELPVSEEGTREWSHGLCSCCDVPGTCLAALCCPCIVYGKVKARHNHLETQGEVLAEPGCCSGDCCLHAVLAPCGLGFIFQMINRGSVRRRYNIKGGGCGDCCTALWCAPCELTQESREIELEEQSLLGYPKPQARR
ncbi:PLAC8-domain-containing protein [Ephemerocybe angulata]|uniref:PLAC8-domain-containing protein n=1 Tax=Ephemerocybe angulata TaxID=980116 RepID=A0A8H6I3M1_9AGAR|nr:PLAC8-domain-containing protein [Tulosesus angulatus]